MSRIRAIIPGLLILIVALFGGYLAWKWGVTRVYVGPEEALVVINRYGNELPAQYVVVPKEEPEKYQGIQEEVRGPGRYFLNPVMYDTRRVPLVNIPAGQPHNWRWTPDGQLADKNTAPQVGLIVMKQGKTPAPDQEVVPDGFKGIQVNVLTPGTYAINPYLMEVKLEPAVVVPPGSVGVVTRLFGERGVVTSATLTEILENTAGPATQEAPVDSNPKAPSRLVVGQNQRGILKDVLQPGIYYLNPRQYKISIVPVGYDEITLEQPKSQVRFYSNDGYQVEADCTVVWGRAPADAPNIIANIGGIDLVEKNVIEPAMKAACQNEGAKYTAKELIQGSTRSKFQDDLAASLERQVASRNIHVLLALVRNVTIKDKSGKDATGGLLSTIQRTNIEIERNKTNEQKTLTAEVKALLEQANKLVDVARETVASDTNVKVANIMAEGQKKAAEVDAHRELEVAEIEMQIARLDAERNLILGKAEATVSQLKRDAEAKGAQMLIDAFGSPEAYNQYIFAKHFDPKELRLIFAGPGTFWTDLKSFQDIGATQVIKQGQEEK